MGSLLLLVKLVSWAGAQPTSLCLYLGSRMECTECSNPMVLPNVNEQYFYHAKTLTSLKAPYFSSTLSYCITLCGLPLLLTLKI